MPRGGNAAAIYYGLGVTEHSQGSTTVLAIANLARALVTDRVAPRRLHDVPPSVQAVKTLRAKQSDEGGYFG
jgi:hypothetical protein